MTSLLFLALFFIGFATNSAYSQAPFPINPFRTTWITTDGTITIPTNGRTGYNYTVTWTNLTNTGVGDGSVSNQTGNYTITGLENNSTYEVAISGDFPHFYMNNNSAESAKIQTIEEWGIIAWQSMESAFFGCSNLTYTATDVPNLSAVTNMSSMFSGCTIFDGNSTMNNWNIETVTNMNTMFSSATVFNQNIGNWNTSAVTNMGGMFERAAMFNQDIGNWNTSAVTDIAFMFGYATVFNQDISNWNTSAVVDMSWLFANTPFNQDISNWNTGSVVYMSAMFLGANSFNQNLGNWNISNVTTMTAMLPNSISIENYDATLIGWATQSVNTGVNLGTDGLNYCNAETARNTLTSAPNNWIITGDNLSTGCVRPFRTTWVTTDGTITIPTNGGAGYNYTVTWTNLTNPTVGDGSASNQTGNYTLTGLENNSMYEITISGDFPRFFMNNDERLKLRTIEEWGGIEWTSMSFAFQNCENLTYMATDSPNLDNVTDMSGMFRGCTSFDGNATMNDWNTSTITNMNSLFAVASSFNQDIGNWNTENVTSMASMFSNATSFNQNLGNWNIENVEQIISYYGMSGMLDNSGLSTANYDATLIGWAAQNVNPNITLGATGLNYCASETARNILTSAPNNWNITGDIFFCFDPEINLQGNGFDIANNSTTPITANATDFGNVLACGSDTLTRIFTVQNTGNNFLITNNIIITGTNASDFSFGTFSSTIAPFSNATFTVTFNPSDLGNRTATIEIDNNDADESLYTFAIQGTGTADTEVPMISAIADTTAQCEIISLNAPYRYDMCAGTIMGTTTQTVPITTQGTTVVEWTFDDGNGNIATVNQNVIITDTEIPTIIAPSNITANTDTGICTASNLTLGTPIGTDNCGIPTFTNDAPTVFPIGLTNVIWTAEDENGNTATATQTVTITAPVEINIKGNGNSIADGSSTVSTTNDTDFGDVITDRTVTYTIENTGTQPLLISSITSDNTDFVVSTIPTTITAGSTSTFDITFSSVSLGLSAANITINNNDCDEAAYDFAIQATKTSTTPPPSGGGTGTGGNTGGGTTGGETGEAGAVDPNPDLIFTGASNMYNANRLDLSWVTNTTISAFRLYRNNVLIRTLSGSSTDYSDANLAANTFYTYTLIAVINGVNSEPHTFEFWTAPNPPSVASVTDVCEEGIATVVLSSNENGTGSSYKVYTEENGGSPVASSDTTFFNLPSVNTQTDFYISTVGGESGKEGERTKITVRVQPTFEAVILGGSTQYSCTNSLVLQAGYIANANSYTWFLDGNEVGTGQIFTATIDGNYEVRINKIVCEVTSEPVQVLLNQVITAQIEENTTTQNSITFCENGNLNAVSAGQDATYKWSLNGNIVGEEQNIAVSQSGT